MFQSKRCRLFTTAVISLVMLTAASPTMTAAVPNFSFPKQSNQIIRAISVLPGAVKLVEQMIQQGDISINIESTVY